jgi:hypothetical protein
MGRTPFQGASLDATSPRAKDDMSRQPAALAAVLSTLWTIANQYRLLATSLGYSVRPLRGHGKMSKLQRESQATPLQLFVEHTFFSRINIQDPGQDPG